MKKTKTHNNNCVKTTLFDWIKITLLTGLGMFIILSVTMIIVTVIWIILYRSGIINEVNFRKVYLYDFSIVTVLVGCFISVFVIRLPVTWTTNLIKAIRSISHGNYDTRLKERKIKAISKVSKEFNSMARQLGMTETLSHDFINNFSHECKTPIASINGFAKMLKNKKLTEDEKNEYLDIIISESERLNNLATDILNLSKLENQTILTDVEKIDITEQIRETAASIYLKAAEKNIEIILPEKSFHTNGNVNMLSIVWLNLLTNAIKFADNDTQIRIDINEDRENVFVSVTDKGCVIPDERKERLFERFYQCDESHSTMGNGLGLAITKRITRLHEGDIVLLESDSNRTTFEVRLPKTNS